RTSGALVRALRAGAAMTEWSKPVLKVYMGEGLWIKPVLTWSFQGSSVNPVDALARTYFVNATTGAVEAARDDVAYDGVSGAATGNATPGVLPDTAANLPVSMPMPEI